MKNHISKGIMWIILSLCAGIFFASLFLKDTKADYYNEVKFGKYNQSITAYDKQIDALIGLGYDITRIIDLITLGAMECRKYTGECKNGTSDIGHMQINQIHKEQYEYSLKLYNEKKWGYLYLYQVQYANGLLDSYENGYCSQESFDSIQKERTNEERFACIARMYNGSDKRKSYGQLAVIKRVYIREYILDYLKE